MAKNKTNFKLLLRNHKGLVILLVSILISFSSGLINPSLMKASYNDFNNKITTSRDVSHTIQWVNNTDFRTTDNWNIIKVNQGPGSDVEGNINQNEAQAELKILGDQGAYSNISDIPNSQEWIKKRNGNLVYPDNSGRDEFGLYANHTWEDPNDSNQSVSVHWERLVTLPVDMSDFNITTINLDVLFNATVTTQNASGDLYKHGIDVEGDFVDPIPIGAFNQSYDYVRFYVLISDINRIDSYEIGFNQTSKLGEDYSSGTIENGNMYIIPYESIRSFLKTVLEKDPEHKSFIFTLGMRIYCADNGQGDVDVWNDLRFLNCNFSFEYIKLMDRSSSISLRQSGTEIEGTNIKIDSAYLNFYYKINKSWKDIDSPNSELRILINNKEHNERIKLTEFTSSFSRFRSSGFNIKNIINPYIPLNLSLQLFLGDNFQLNESVIVSFDNVTLSITYTEMLSEILSEPWYAPYLLFAGIVLAIMIAGGFLSYYFIYRYPKPVRKLRKYRKSLRTDYMPNINVKSQKGLFNSEYKRELRKRSVQKSKVGKSKIGINAKFIFILFIIFSLFLFPLIILTNQENHILKKYPSIENNNIVEISKEIPYSKNWINNSNFENNSYWRSVAAGDHKDFDYEISDGQANYLILGNEKTFITAQGIPNSTFWNESKNEDYPYYPDIHSIQENRGCYVSHEWVENSDQTPSVHWERDIEMPEDMKDKIITSISLSTKINATVTTESGNWSFYGVDTISDNPDEYATGDYARFYVLFSDIEEELVYEVAYNQTKELGRDGTTGEMIDTFLTNIPEERIIEYLTNILKRNSTAFKITLGIRIWCEDNYQEDRDYWDELLIKEFDLNITYANKIDKFNSISWTQVGEKISGETVRVTDANLKFKYKINDTWPESKSPSSEVRIIINENQHTETIRLSSANGEFQLNNPDGYDVTDLILKDININTSIQLYLADTFDLNRTIKISIDEVYLQITYVDVIIDVTPEPWINTAFFIGVSTIAIALGIYFIAYYKVYRFPIPIRKVRKFRRSLKHTNPPKDMIIRSRDNEFRKQYASNTRERLKSFKLKGSKSGFK